jgi:tetratricopeptide (TPR) repeat protein
MPKVQIFLSAVTGQFKQCRDALRSDLSAVGAEVKVQEDFQQHGGLLLEKLRNYIAACDRVIALIGDAYGFEPDEAARPTNRPRRSYTQWEYFFALGERFNGPNQPRKNLYVYFGSPEFLTEHCVNQTDEAARLQSDFVAEVHRSGKDWNRFSSLDELRALVLRDGFRLPEHGPKPIHLPYSSLGDLFKGRDAKLDELRTSLTNAPQTGAAAIVGKALHGLGGVGKTRLAVEYAWRHAGDYTALLFVTADSPENLNRNLAALCAPAVLDLPENQVTEEAVQVAAVLSWLQRNPGWLLILDNVDTEAAGAAAENLLPHLPGGHVLITSRLGNWSGGVEALPLDVLQTPAAVEFLLARTEGKRRKQPDDPAQARTLADELGGLALALEQAGAYIAQRRLTFAAYLAEWHGQRDKVLAWFDPRLMQYPKSVAITWQTSFDQLSDNARDLLQLLAWLAPEAVPESLLELPLLGAEATDTLFGALAELEGYSLVTRAADSPTFTVHRLVQEVTRASLRNDTNHTALNGSLKWIIAAFVGDPQDVRNWPTLDPLAPHAHAVAAHADRAAIAEPTARLMNQVGILLYTKALYAEAEPLMRQALAIDEQSYGPEHPDVARDLNSLAQLLKATNRLAEAEPLMRRALAIAEQSLGENHPNVAAALNNLVTLLQATHRLAEAEPLMRRALAIDEQSGPEHPNVAIGLHNLAQLLQDTHHLSEAESLMRRALAIAEQSLGENHHNVAALNNLAQLLKATNRLPEAEPLMRRALLISVKTLGTEHPNSETVLGNYFALLQAMGRTKDEIRRELASLLDRGE